MATPIYNASLFAQYFANTDPAVIAWSENILEKLYAQGIVPKYITRQENTSVANAPSSDADYINFWRPITLFWAYAVELSRIFENFTGNRNLLREHLLQRGYYPNNDQTLDKLIYMMEKALKIRAQRGTIEMYQIGDTGDSDSDSGAYSDGYDSDSDAGMPYIDGELLKLIQYRKNDFFQLGNPLPKYAAWNVNNYSPLYTGLTGRYDLNLGYEWTEDVISLTPYPLINPTACSIAYPSIGGSWTLEAGAAAIGWASVCYGNGLFVAVTTTNYPNQIMTSPDGITWTLRTSPVNATWSAVCYGNGLFVAVASGSSNIMTSPDGITWTARTGAASGTWTAITYGNGTYVVVGNSTNKAMTSSDGITWTLQTLPVTSSFASIVYGNGLFVTTAQLNTNNEVFTSPDGVTWTTRTQPLSTSFRGAAFGNNLFVFFDNLGSGNFITSSDGVTWTSHTTSSTSSSWISVTYGNGTYVAIGYNSHDILTSNDGITWTLTTGASSSLWYSIAYGNNEFVVVNASAIANNVQINNTVSDTKQSLSIDSTTGLAGIGKVDLTKALIIDPQLNFEITFQVRQLTLNNNFTFGCLCFDQSNNPISLLSVVTGSNQQNFFSDKQLNKSTEYYFVRGIIYNSNQSLLSSTDAQLNIGFGNNLKFPSNAKKIIPYIVADNTGSSTVLHIWNLKINVASLSYNNVYTTGYRHIDIFLKNNNPSYNRDTLYSILRKYFMPYSASFTITHLGL